METTLMSDHALINELLSAGHAETTAIGTMASGNVQPRRSDKALALALKAALAQVDVRGIGHFIVTGGRLLSFAEQGQA